MKALSSSLSTIPCFSTLHLADVSFLESIVSTEYVEAGHNVFLRGGSADKFYVILAGTVSLQLLNKESGALPLMNLNSGELIGWSWFVPPHQWNFDALALNPCELLAFDATSVRRRMDWDNGFGYRVMKSLALTMHDRMTATRLQLIRHHDD
ncbi:MAG: cyclic nucleotide-binding domain-containing protein [Opitutales bacterium]|nr:cyclic nucleotide-binding domain-containing protein [Opitutales bacterium]